MIYLDSAATSLLKPDGVQYAVLDAMNNMASPGRGAHPYAIKAAEKCYECREKIAKLFHVPDTENVVMTFNATHGLNIAINSVVPRGGKVLVSGYEHNSVIRPLHALGAEIIRLQTPLFDQSSFLEEAGKNIKNVDAVICTHVSNVFGFVLPVYELARLCGENGKPFIVDASQSAGVLDLDFMRLGADFAAFPGHKGLMGPQGTGVLLCKNDAKPLLYGGSGSESANPNMPDYLPDRLEAGTHNVCGIAGLCAGVNYILEKGTEYIRLRESEMLRIFCNGMKNCEAVKVIYDPDFQFQSGLASVIPLRCTCEAFAETLGERGIAVRSGLQCAPDAHKTAGTFDTGTVRFSFSPLLSYEDVEEAVEISKKILTKY